MNAHQDHQRDRTLPICPFLLGSTSSPLPPFLPLSPLFSRLSVALPLLLHALPLLALPLLALPFLLCPSLIHLNYLFFLSLSPRTNGAYQHIQGLAAKTMSAEARVGTARAHTPAMTGTQAWVHPDTDRQRLEPLEPGHDVA